MPPLSFIKIFYIHEFILLNFYHYQHHLSFIATAFLKTLVEKISSLYSSLEISICS